MITSSLDKEFFPVLSQRLAAAQSVAAQLFPAEHNIEQAIVSVSRLAIAIVEGRQAAKLPISAGQDSLVMVSEVAGALIQARSKVIEAHVSLARDKAEMGLATRAMGDWGECPPAAAELQQSSDTLRLVV